MRKADDGRTGQEGTETKGLTLRGQEPGTRNCELIMMIAITDQQIDALVHELYGLTENKIRMVEGEVLPI